MTFGKYIRIHILEIYGAKLIWPINLFRALRIAFDKNPVSSFGAETHKHYALILSASCKQSIQLQREIQEATSPSSHEFSYLLFLWPRLSYIKSRNLITTKAGMEVLFYIAYFHFRSYSFNGAATCLTISMQPVNKPINQLPSSAVQGLSTQLANECSTYNEPVNSLSFSQTFDIWPFSEWTEDMATTSHPIFLGQLLNFMYRASST